MVTCIPKSRTKLVGDESQTPFRSIFHHRRSATRRRHSSIRGETFLYPFQSEQGSLCASRCFLSYLFDLLKSQVPSVEELAAEEQVRKHCKGQRLPSFPRIKLKNHLPLVVGDGKIERKLPQRCCEAFVEYLRRAGTELDLKRGISII